MDHPKINLLHQRFPEPPAKPLSPPRARRLLRRTGLVVTVVLVGLFVANVVVPGVRLSQSVGQASVWVQLQHLVGSGSRHLQGENDDRINVLIMGIGGTGHEGPLLTDTLLLASIQPSTGRAALISIPRDFYIPYPNGTWHKINEVYVHGETQNPGRGAAAATQTVANTLGVTIPYYLVVDFQGFKQVVDHLGGVYVSVDQAFTDPTYPKDDEIGIKTVSFKAGGQWMNGTTALEFARSRHGTNGEGSDFARSKRQQKILLAVKDRILSSNVLLNPVTINKLVGELGDNVDTNVESWELWSFADLARRINTEQITRTALSADPDGVLVEGTSAGGAYILSPRGGDFSIIERMVQNVFGQRDTALEPTRLFIENGTFSEAVLTKAVADAKRLGFIVVGTRNAATRPASTTTLMDYTNGGKLTSQATLRLSFQPATTTTAVPPWLQPLANDYTGTADKTNTPPKETDFVLTLGTDKLIATP